MTDTKQSAIKAYNNSKEYIAIKKDAESNWPAWKVSIYNSSIAVSAHAKKVIVKQSSY